MRGGGGRDGVGYGTWLRERELRDGGKLNSCLLKGFFDVLLVTTSTRCKVLSLSLFLFCFSFSLLRD